MVAEPRPLAVGILALPAGADALDRSRARVRFALHADREGYTLLDVLEVAGHPLTDGSVYAAVEDLSLRFGARALLFAGPVDAGHLTLIAEEVGLTVFTVLD